jgi:hypothetical protein
MSDNNPSPKSNPEIPKTEPIISKNVLPKNWDDEQYRLLMDDLAKNITNMVLSFQASCQRLSESLQASPLLNIDWPKILAQRGQGCERLANLGWTTPMTFSLHDFAEIAEHCTSDQEIEQYMLNHFTTADSENFMDIRDITLHSTKLVGWQALLQQCFDAYDRGHYLVTIPALLSVIEGAVAQKAGKLKSTQVNTRKLATDLKKATQLKNQDGMHFLIWRSARVVLDKLFANSDFGGPHPGELNRHWVLHGRDQTQWTQIDTLRLFNLIASISDS